MLDSYREHFRVLYVGRLRFLAHSTPSYNHLHNEHFGGSLLPRLPSTVHIPTHVKVDNNADPVKVSI